MLKYCVVGLLILLTGCSSPSKSNSTANSEETAKANDEVERYRKERRERKSWSLEKMEKHYEGLKLQPFYFLNELLDRTVAEKNWHSAELYANDFLNTAGNFKNNWNYGNAIFYGNLALAGSALQSGNKKKSLHFLKQSSLAPGSPQLDSFGPFNDQFYNSILTDIYNSGERKALIEFAKNCKSFLIKDDPKILKWNSDQIDHFIEQVSKNQAPDYKIPGIN